jgi:hypothetical protein
MNTRSTRSQREEAAVVVAESAIPGVSVPEVRRGLDALRTAWNNADAPFYFSAPLSVDVPDAGTSRKRKKAPEKQEPSKLDTMESFCIKYIMGHHVKRHEKSKQHPKANS